MPRRRTSGLCSRRALRAAVTVLGAAAVAVALSGCWNAPRNLFPLEDLETADIVGSWDGRDDDSLTFNEDGTCQINSIPVGALQHVSIAYSNDPLGDPVNASCRWEVDGTDVRVIFDEPLDGDEDTYIWYDTALFTNELYLYFNLGDPDSGHDYRLHKAD